MQKGKTGLNDFKFGTFVRCFQREAVASRAAKGLRGLLTSHTYGPRIVKLKLSMTDNQNRQATDHLSVLTFSHYVNNITLVETELVSVLSIVRVQAGTLWQFGFGRGLGCGFGSSTSRGWPTLLGLPLLPGRQESEHGEMLDTHNYT